MTNALRTLRLAALAAAAAATAIGCAPSGAPSDGSPAAPASQPTTAQAASNANAAAAAPDGPVAEIGKPAPDFVLKDTEGRELSLSSFKGKTVVLEWFNPDCPFVKANHASGSLKEMARKHVANGVVWLGVNSGAPGKQGAGIENSNRGKKTYGMDHPVLVDESGDVGRRYGAKTTPHMFVIDARGILVYRGAIDNAPHGEPLEGNEVVNYVENALADLAAGKPVSVPETPPYGCSVKYASR